MFWAGDRDFGFISSEYYTVPSPIVTDNINETLEFSGIAWQYVGVVSNTYTADTYRTDPEA